MEGEQFASKIGPSQENIPDRETHKEIERGFLVKSLPENLEEYHHEEIIQGYLAITEDGTEIRIRKEGDKYFQVIKRETGKTRFELIVEITEEQFKTLWEVIKGRKIEKTRYRIPYGNNIIEVDVYHGDLEGLVLAEVEFVNEDESNKFMPPDWVGQEITYDESCLCYNYLIDNNHKKCTEQTERG
jgi:CYTH domain-containing protein